MQLETNHKLKPLYHVQEQFLNDFKNQFIGFQAGLGAGKTTVGAMKLFVLILYQLPHITSSLVVEPTHKMLQDVAIPKLIEIADQMGLTLKINNKDKRIIVNELSTKQTPCLIHLRSAEAAIDIKGFEVAQAWLDEPASYRLAEVDVKQDAVIQSIGRLRHPKARHKQMLFTGTPELTGSRFDKLFESPRPGYKLYRASTLDNPLMKDYVENILKPSYPPELWPLYLDGIQVNLGGSTVYSAFDQRFNVKDDLKYDESLPLHISLDFNKRPSVHAVLGQEKDQTLFALDEIYGSPETQKIIEKIVYFIQGKKFPAIHIFGDASGRHSPTAASTSDYDIVRKILSKAGYHHLQFRLTPRNPLIKDRTNALNLRLSDINGKKWWFCTPRCKKLIQDFQQCKWDLHGKDIDDQRGKIGHCSDAEGYRCYIIHKPRSKEEIEKAKPQFSVHVH
jgi:hypothetical protein